MSAPVNPAPAAPIRVPAGTTAAAAVGEAGLPRRGALNAIRSAPADYSRILRTSWNRLIRARQLRCGKEWTRP